ncbi:MAG: hypothetical protein IJQ71_01425 [Clostridia bacterium]|nr:hypothetical protein [Clostridia bacterium]
MSGKTVSSGKRWVYAVLVLLSVCGTAISVWNLIRTFQGTLTVMGVLQSVIQVLAHLAILGYVLYTNRMEGETPFLGVVYAYAALLGIQLLQSGQMISGFGLSKELTMMINIFNLIAFADVIMFANKLDRKKASIGYMASAAILKLAGELILIFKMLEFINFGVILISLSVPVLGLTILFAYLVYIQSEPDDRGL